MFSGKQHIKLHLKLHMRSFTIVRVREMNSSTTKKRDETKMTCLFEAWKAISQFRKKNNAISKFSITCFSVMSIYDNYPVKKSVLDYTYDMFYQIFNRIITNPFKRSIFQSFRPKLLPLQHLLVKEKKSLNGTTWTFEKKLKFKHPRGKFTLIWSFICCYNSFSLTYLAPFPCDVVFIIQIVFFIAEWK